jgi:hypothetical protein
MPPQSTPFTEARTVDFADASAKSRTGLRFRIVVTRRDNWNAPARGV